jgi:hypothetical protein
MGSNARRFGDDGDVDLKHCIPGTARSTDGDLQHLERIASAIGGIAVGKELSDVAGADGTENGIRDGMGNRVTVGVTVEVAIEGDLDAAEFEWSTLCKAMRVVADANARSHKSVNRRLPAALGMSALRVIPSGEDSALPHAATVTCGSGTMIE